MNFIKVLNAFDLGHRRKGGYSVRTGDHQRTLLRAVKSPTKPNEEPKNDTVILLTPMFYKLKFIYSFLLGILQRILYLMLYIF